MRACEQRDRSRRSARAAVFALVGAASIAVFAVAAFAQAPTARAQAEQLLAEVSANAAADSVGAAVMSARGALATGSAARDAQEAAHAAIADETGLEWAAVAQSLQAGDALGARAQHDERACAGASASASAAARRLDEALERRAALRTSLAALDAELPARPLASSSHAGTAQGATRAPSPSHSGTTR